MIMNRSEIQKLLPHRDPMLLVDSVSELIPSKSICSVTKIDPDWDILKGHFPGMPILPGIYITECMAQAAALLLLSNEVYAGKFPLLFQINKMRFIRPVYPEDLLCVTAILISDSGNQMYDFAVTASVNEKKIASGSITICLK